MRVHGGPGRRSAGAKGGYGFTLVELIIVVTILAILLVTAAPNLRGVIQNNRATALANELSTAISFARSEAVKRGAEVMVCPSTNLSTCGGTWTDSWIVLPATGGAPLRVWPANPDYEAVITQAPIANQAIRFDALGARASAGTTLNAGVAGCRGNRARQIDIGPGGRISIQALDCAALG